MVNSRSEVNEMKNAAGAILTILGMSAMDSEKLWIPVVMVAVGMLLLAAGKGARNE